jgi:hypothetical protein
MPLTAKVIWPWATVSKRRFRRPGSFSANSLASRAAAKRFAGETAWLIRLSRSRAACS